MKRRLLLAGTCSSLLPRRAAAQASSAPATGSAEQPLRLAVAARQASTWVAGNLLTRIYAQAHLSLRIFPLPSGRASLDVLSGYLDGDVCRIAGYREGRPEVLRVDPPYYGFTGHAFSLPVRRLKIRGREDLTRLRVGHLAGVLWIKEVLANVPQTYVAQTAEQLYQMMKMDRVDVVLDGQLNGRRWQGITGTKLDESAEVCRNGLYHYLHRRHADLIPALSSAITDLQASGELQRLTQHWEKVVMTLSAEQFD